MSSVPVTWAVDAGLPKSEHAAVTDAAQARLAPVARRATSGATGTLLAGAGIHLHGRGRGVGGGCGGRRGRRAERDVALDGTPELHEVRVSSPRREGEHGG